MSTITNKEFLIANKTSKVILELSNILEVVPKKYYYQKNKTLGYAYELLETIYIVNNADYDISREVQIIKKDITMLDFSLGFFVDKKCLSIKQTQKTIYYLTEISKMTNVWFSNMKEKRQ